MSRRITMKLSAQSKSSVVLALRFGSLAIGGVVMAALLVAVVIKWAPQWLASTDGLSRTDRLAETGRVRTALLAMLAGGIAVVGLVYTARTFALTRQGQITERFTRAVDQLGSKELDVRLGGIYALERLARESRDDHGPIAEILTAFVREHAPLPTEADEDAEPVGTRTDVQAVLTVLGRRNVAHDGGTRIALMDTAFPAADLTGAHLERAMLARAYLPRAQLLGAELTGANFERASLQETEFADAHLERAFFLDANLMGADFSQAHLEGAIFATAYLKQAFLEEAHLLGANLRDASLDGAYLRGGAP